jgi:hypothetical protein
VAHARAPAPARGPAARTPATPPSGVNRAARRRLPAAGASPFATGSLPRPLLRLRAARPWATMKCLAFSRWGL